MPIAIDDSLSGLIQAPGPLTGAGRVLKGPHLGEVREGPKRRDARTRRQTRASERFRKDGIDGAGVGTLMADAGLTHGGFYAHFDSKAAMGHEAVAFAFSTVPKQFTGHADARRDLEELIDWYLSPGHRDKPGKECPFAALAPDLVRRPKAARVVFAKGAQNILERIVTGLPPLLSLQGRQSLAYAVMA